MMGPVTQKLIDARDILETKGWTQGAIARDADGNSCFTASSDVVCFCGLGALLKACGSESVDFSAMWYLTTTLGPDIPFNNDEPETTILHVMMAYDFAILMSMDEEALL